MFSLKIHKKLVQGFFVVVSPKIKKGVCEQEAKKVLIFKVKLKFSSAKTTAFRLISNVPITNITNHQEGRLEYCGFWGEVKLSHVSDFPLGNYLRYDYLQ